MGRAGGLCRGRRKPVLGGLAAASMPRTPLPSPPARPLTVSVCVHPRKRKKEQEQKQLGCALFVEPSPRSAAVRDRPSRARARLYIFLRHQKPLLPLPSASPHEPVEAGAVWAGRGIRAMDGAAKPPRTGLRRPLPAHTTPAHPQHHEAPALWLWPLLLPLLLLLLSLSLSPCAPACRRHQPSRHPHPIQWPSAVARHPVPEPKSCPCPSSA